MSPSSDLSMSRAEPPDSSTPSPRKDNVPIRVFVVDDHPAIREVIAMKAADIDEIEVVGTSEEASEGFAEIEERDPDVALVDISLGGIDGLTLTRSIRSEIPETRVLIFSKYEEPLYAKRSIRAGASGYLPKSSPIPEVMEAIKSISDGGIHLRRDILSDLLNETIRGDKTSEQGIQSFTDREMTVFQMLGDGDTVPQIADHLNLSRKTVETYRRRAKKKVGCDTVHELVRYAVLWTRDRKCLSSSPS